MKPPENPTSELFTNDVTKVKISTPSVEVTAKGTSLAVIALLAVLGLILISIKAIDVAERAMDRDTATSPLPRTGR